MMRVLKVLLLFHNFTEKGVRFACFKNSCTFQLFFDFRRQFIKSVFAVNKASLTSYLGYNLWVQEAKKEILSWLFEGAIFMPEFGVLRLLKRHTTNAYISNSYNCGMTRFSEVRSIVRRTDNYGTKLLCKFYLLSSIKILVF